MFYALGVLALIITIALAVPKIRNELWKRLEPAWNQIWQRLVWVLGQPQRLAVGILGNLIMTVSYVAAFGASLAAFGYTLDPTTLAITFLASTSLGSVVPSPGGTGRSKRRSRPASPSQGFHPVSRSAPPRISTGDVLRTRTTWMDRATNHAEEDLL